MSETSDFLKDLGIVQPDNFDKPLEDEPEKVTETEEEEEDGFKARNRREKRLLEKNQQLREEAIAAIARAQALDESRTTREAEPAEYLKRIERIYGNQTPEGREATELLKEALEGVKQSVKQEWLEEQESYKGNERQAVRQEEDNLDSILEKVEDEYGINMDSDANRRGYLTLLERVSPKDRDGNIIEYADEDTVAELFISTREKSNSRAKELASRSMSRGGQSSGSTLEKDSTERFLRDAGII